MDRREVEIAELYDRLMRAGMAPADAARSIAVQYLIESIALIDQMYDRWLQSRVTETMCQPKT